MGKGLCTRRMGRASSSGKLEGPCSLLRDPGAHLVITGTPSAPSATKRYPGTYRAESPGLHCCPLLSLLELLKSGIAEIVPQIQMVGSFATWEIQPGPLLTPLHCEKASCWMEIPSYLFPGSVLQLPRLQNSLEDCWTSKTSPFFFFFFLKPTRLRPKGQ